jgi:UDP-N-acetylglucosamine:LPS N-acetylglucosamine transferase
MKIFAVASNGGHWVQLKRMSRAFSIENAEVVYACSESVNAPDGTIVQYVVPDCSASAKLQALTCFLVILKVMIKERPQIVISTGAAPGALALLAGKCVGAKTIWIDSIANSESVSESCKLVSRFSNKVFTQWEHLKTKDIGCLGRVL